jgi:undecaprenyl diphosphate synthase
MTEDYSKSSKIPQHVAIIMDGNGRWARERSLPRAAGHQAGVQSVREVVESSIDLGISILTLFAFSQENWKRPKEEVSVLMQILDVFLDKEIHGLVRKGVQFRTIGHIEALPENVQKRIAKVVRETSRNHKLIFNIALNYGSRTEILDAVREILLEASAGAPPANDPARGHGTPLLNGGLTEEFFSRHLYTRGLPDPDLLIRTSGEMRLSNFLLWQLSYAEIYITKKYWPDFRKDDFMKAIQEYEKRERRFGDVGLEGFAK